MAVVNIPPQIILPPPRDDKEAELFRAIDDYFNQIRQTLIEVVENLP